LDSAGAAFCLARSRAARTVGEPFSQDITPHVRFLFALPLLVIADLIVRPQLIQVLRQFVMSGIVRDSRFPKFKEIVKAAVRLRESKTAELVVLAIAYATCACPKLKPARIDGASRPEPAAQQ
jgi:hypothetical protein